MNAVDTNILLYVHDPRDPRKQKVAAELVKSLTQAVLLWQVACEYISNGYKLKFAGFDAGQAFGNVRDFSKTWNLMVPNVRVLEQSERLLKLHSLSYWDSMILGAALEAGVTKLYTEDMGSNRVIEGVNLINPFASTANATAPAANLP